jgi:hypothetical protein
VVLSVAPGHSIYWHHGHICHSDYRSNRKDHRAIHSYISINVDKYFRNNSHCNYWHHWHHRHNSYSDYWNNRKYHRAIHSYTSINGDKHSRNNCH